jgi:hypothetical protein
MHDPVQICTGRAASPLYEYGEAFLLPIFLMRFLRAEIHPVRSPCSQFQAGKRQNCTQPLRFFCIISASFKENILYKTTRFAVK